MGKKTDSREYILRKTTIALLLLIFLVGIIGLSVQLTTFESRRVPTRETVTPQSSVVVSLGITEPPAEGNSTEG